MSVEEHKQDAPACVNCMVVTVSDTRNEMSDKSGKLMISLLEGHGHKVTRYHIVKDEYAAIQQILRDGKNEELVDVILLNGGTGITGRDTTCEAVENLLDKHLPGFGELFRMLSFTEDIGSAAMLSRATAGVAGGKAVFSMPGSSGAVRLALEKLIIPELGHIIKEIKRDRQ